MIKLKRNKNNSEPTTAAEPQSEISDGIREIMQVFSDNEERGRRIGPLPEKPKNPGKPPSKGGPWIDRRFECSCPFPEYQMETEREIMRKAFDLMQKWYCIKTYENVWAAFLYEVFDELIKPYFERPASDLFRKMAANAALLVLDYVTDKGFNRRIPGRADFLRHPKGEEVRRDILKLRSGLEDPLREGSSC